MRLTVFLALLALLLIPAPVAASDEDASVRLGVEAIGVEGSYFDITLEPGESAELTVRFSNYGDVGTGASVYVADVYTIPGGGMGMRQIDQPRTGPSEWLGLESEELELQPEEAVEQTFTVTVPDDTPPGDYITSVVIQNTEPVGVGDEDDDQFNQTVRQGIAVAIDVPGPREPALEIGQAEHSVSGSRSVVLVDIANTGNAHLRPEGVFALLDSGGDVLTDSPVAMDTVYAGTETVLEVPFQSRLEPGDYQVNVRLEDPETGAGAAAQGLAFEVPEETDDGGPEADESGEDAAGAGSTEDTDEPGPGPLGWIVAVVAIFAMLGLVTSLATFFVRRLGDRPAPQPEAPPRRAESPAPEPPPQRANGARSVRQLVPPKRSG